MSSTCSNLGNYVANLTLERTPAGGYQPWCGGNYVSTHAGTMSRTTTPHPPRCDESGHSSRRTPRRSSSWELFFCDKNVGLPPELRILPFLVTARCDLRRSRAPVVKELRQLIRRLDQRQPTSGGTQSPKETAEPKDLEGQRQGFGCLICAGSKRNNVADLALERTPAGGHQPRCDGDCVSTRAGTMSWRKSNTPPFAAWYPETPNLLADLSQRTTNRP